MRVGGAVAAAVRDFSEQRLGPYPLRGVHARRGRQRVVQGIVRRGCLAGDAVDRCAANHRVQRRHDADEAFTVRACPGILAPYRQHRGAGEQRLGMFRVALQDAVEINHGRVEFVAALQDRRAQHQHRGRRVRVRPPWPERGLRVAQEARIALDARRANVRRSQGEGGSRIARRFRRLGLPHPQLAELRRAPAREALEHLGVVGRHVGRRAHAERDDESGKSCCAASNGGHGTSRHATARDRPGPSHRASFKDAR